jgi:branched-chain amino acid transport system permease protein
MNVQIFPLKRTLLVLVILGLIVFPVILTQSQGRSADPTITLFVFIFVWVGLGSAWNILGGFAGQLSLGHAAYYGLGAYSAAIVFDKLEIAGWWGILIGPIVVIPIAWAIGWITFRLRGPYFALATIAVGEIVFLLAKNFPDFTGGSVGIEVKRDYFWPTGSDWRWLVGRAPYKIVYYWIALALVLLTIYISWRIAHSKMGYYLRAIREDEDTAATIGINTTRYKIYAFVISASLAASIGAFRANFSVHVDPDTVLKLGYSIEMVLVAIIGGLGTVWGPVVGGIVLTVAGDYFIEWFGEANQLVFGVLLVVVIFFSPKGLVGIFDYFWARWRGETRTPPDSRSEEVDHAAA